MLSPSADELIEFVTQIFHAVGLPEHDARTVAISLVGSNLRGHDSHGVMRVPQYVDFIERGEYQIGVSLRIEQETDAVIVCDAQWGLGQIQAHRLLERLIPKAQTLGIAAGAARSCGHVGRLGEYAERASDVGMILLATVNNAGSGARVAPPGGLEPRLGTNPLCAGVPTVTDPVVLDFGTSAVAEGKVRVHYINGKKPVPEGWLIDHEGKPTTDPTVLYEAPLGSILPMGGQQAYKGFGLGLVLDMIAAGLTGGRCPHPNPPPVKGNNVVFILIDPARFAGRDCLTHESTQLCEYVRTTPRAEGVSAITLPGDPERITFERRSMHGIPLEDAHWAKLTGLAERLKVAVPAIGATA
jgi:uncharacterized oxidoreductase